MSKKLICAVCVLAAVAVAGGTSLYTQFDDDAPGVYANLESGGISFKGTKGGKFLIGEHPAMVFGQSLIAPIHTENMTARTPHDPYVVVSAEPSIGIRFQVADNDLSDGQKPIVQCWTTLQNIHNQEPGGNIVGHAFELFPDGVWGVHQSLSFSGGAPAMQACRFANCVIDAVEWILPDASSTASATDDAPMTDVRRVGGCNGDECWVLTTWDRRQSK